MFCYQCGAPVPEGTKFCTHCGAPVVPPGSLQGEAPAPSAPEQAPVRPAAPSEETVYLDEQAGESTEYVSEEEAADWFSCEGAPWDDIPEVPAQPPVGSPPPGRRTPPPAGSNPPRQTPPNRQTPPSRRGPSAGVIIAVVLVCLLGLAAVSAAVLLSLRDSGERGGSTPAPTGAAEMVNWSYYAGVWTLDGADGVTLTLTDEDGTLSLSLHQSDPYRSIEGTFTPEGDGLRLDYTDDGQGCSGSILLSAQGEVLSVSASSADMDALKYTGMATRTEGAAADPAPSSSAEAQASASPSPNPSGALPGDDGYLLYENGETVSFAPNDILTVRGDVHFWPTDSVRITQEDLSKLTRTEIQVIRNEIYARYGYPFTDQRWQDLFGGLEWYQRSESYTDLTLPELVQDNVDTILAYETAQGWRS